MKKHILLFSILTLTVAAGGIATAAMMRSPQDQKMTGTITSQRAKIYKQIGDFDQFTTLVMKGRVIQVDPSIDIKTGKDAQGNLVPSPYPELYTDSHVKVEKVWFGDSALLDTEIIVRQNGGTLQNYTVTDEDAQLDAGDEVILFLYQTKVQYGLAEGDGWGILGNGAGHATIQNAIVTFNTVDPFAEPFEGKRVELFEQALDAYYSNKQ